MELHPKVREYLATIDLASEDNRLQYNQEAKLAYWFHMFADQALLNLGRVWVGCVFRQSAENTLLIVKAKQGDTQEVVFINGKTPIHCMRIFCRKLYAETLAWKHDRYA